VISDQFVLYIQTLLDLGMSTNYKDVDGLTPLYVSIVNGLGTTSERFVQTLLFDHSVVGARDRSGWTELHQVIHILTRMCDDLQWPVTALKTRNAFYLELASQLIAYINV